MQITSQLQGSERRKAGRGSRKEAAAGVEWERTEAELRGGTHGVRLETPGEERFQGRRDSIQRRTPQAVLGSWYLSQDGEWKRGMRYLPLSSSSKNVSQIPHCVKTKMNREKFVALLPSYTRNALSCWPRTAPTAHPRSPAPKEGLGIQNMYQMPHHLSARVWARR